MKSPLREALFTFTNEDLIMEKMTLEDTIDLMLSLDWEDRFYAEYFQTKIRLDKLQEFLRSEPIMENPKTQKLLTMQANTMAAYLEILNERAITLGLDLNIGKKRVA